MIESKIRELEELDRQLAEQQTLARDQNKIFFINDGTGYFTLNPLQQELVDSWSDQRFSTFTFCGANQIGKSLIETIVYVSVMLGEWPWTGEKIKFPHNKPRKVRLVGQGWETHIKTVLIPKINEWWPKSRVVETKKNNQGVDATWIDKITRSTLELMSNSQDSDTFEGWEGDLVVYDEPPRREIRVACSRGLIARKGRELFCMTLLKEAWIHREVIKGRLEDGSPDMSIKNLNGDINVNVGFGLTQEGVDKFARSLKQEEKEARLYGKPSYMSSLVFPRFDRLQHVKEPFKIPLDAVVDISIDFHPSKRWAVVFLATTKNNFKYVTDEIWEHGNPKYIAEQIIRVVDSKQYRVNSIIIDPLAKGGTDNDIDVFSIVSETLGSRNLPLSTASKDKEVGISLVNNLLWTENDMPGMYFFRTCGKTIEQVENLMYDPETFKPQKTEDDFTECLYRLALRDTQWYPEFKVIEGGKRSVML